ncbi:MAG: sigma-70 family RNA polymerase sigma factor [Subdoligranulum sp.]|nr:sigma-70 family RNA polymerase sigma factor [Subdoligranulum sp.]
MKQEEFARLVQQYERLVYTICYQFVKDPQLAEDLAQETFLSAYTHRDDCPPGSYKPWLARIAANKAKDYLKSAYRRRVSASQDDTLDALANTGAEPPPEELAVTRDEAARAKAAILALKEPYHQAAVLFFLEEKDIGEIAAALHRPPKTVHTQIYRARMLLRDALKGETTHGAVP